MLSGLDRMVGTVDTTLFANLYVLIILLRVLYIWLRPIQDLQQPA